MEQLQRTDEQQLRKRRFTIGIICIVVGLLGLLLTALTQAPAEAPETPPAITESA